MNKIHSKPTVSIIVITYNSADSVLDTLNSIKHQTYEHIQLIISDDGSKDNTIDVCEEWTKENNNRFTNIQIITVETNSGVPANCNRGLVKSNGKFIKIIAGDDILHKRCIDINMEYMEKFPYFDVLVSNMLRFENVISNINKGIVIRPKYHDIWNNCTVEEQYKLVNIAFIGNSPTFFCRAEVYDIIKYDEEIKFMEDYPFVLNILKKGLRMIYVDELTVYYRYGNSASNSSKLLFNKFYIEEEDFREKYIYKNVSTNVMLYYKYDFYRKKLIQILGLNKRNFIGKSINKLTTIFNPFSASLNKKI